MDAIRVVVLIAMDLIFASFLYLSSVRQGRLVSSDVLSFFGEVLGFLRVELGCTLKRRIRRYL